MPEKERWPNVLEMLIHERIDGNASQSKVMHSKMKCPTYDRTRVWMEGQNTAKGIIKNNVAINTSDLFWSTVLYAECLQCAFIRLYSWIVRFQPNTQTLHTPSSFAFLQWETISSHEFRQTVEAFTHFIATFIDWSLSLLPTHTHNLSRSLHLFKHRFWHTFINPCVLVPGASASKRTLNDEKFSLSFQLEYRRHVWG